LILSWEALKASTIGSVPSCLVESVQKSRLIVPLLPDVESADEAAVDAAAEVPVDAAEAAADDAEEEPHPARRVALIAVATANETILPSIPFFIFTFSF